MERITCCCVVFELRSKTTQQQVFSIDSKGLLIFLITDVWSFILAFVLSFDKLLLLFINNLSRILLLFHQYRLDSIYFYNSVIKFPASFRG